MPPGTLNLDSFFNMRTNSLKKLLDLSRYLSRKVKVWSVRVHWVWCYHCSQMLTDIFFFQKNGNTSMLLLCLSWCYLSLLLSIFFFFFNFGAFLKSCEIQKSKMVDPIWPPLGNNGVFTASYDVITSRCRPQRKHPSTYCLSSRPDCRSFYSYKVMRRGKESPQYPPPKHNDRNVLVGIHFVRYRAT